MNEELFDWEQELKEEAHNNEIHERLMDTDNEYAYTFVRNQMSDSFVKELTKIKDLCEKYRLDLTEVMEWA